MLSSVPELPPHLTAPPAEPFPIPAAFEEGHFETDDVDAANEWTQRIAKADVQSAIFESRNAHSFDLFGLPDDVLKGLYSAMSFDRPSEIQAVSLPLIAKPPYYSIVAQAQNGSGKTCCFALCILTRLDYSLHEPQALVVVPTRELAIQNEVVIKKMGSFTPVTVLSSKTGYEKTINSPIDHMVVVSTMGTLFKWMSLGFLKLKEIRVAVFDEADVMLKTENFQEKSLMLMVRLDREADTPQLLMFSATYDESIKDYAQTMFASFPRPNVRQIYLAKEELSLYTIAQANVQVNGYHDKIRVVTERILPICGAGKVIIFVDTRSAAAQLHKILTTAGWTVTAISGEMDFGDRDRVVDEFRRSVTNILVSTDVLARGFDVLEVNVVINFDLPREYETRTPAYETYLHRVGRSGRFRRHGVAFNLVNELCIYGDDKKLVDQIASHFDREIPYVNIEDDAVLKDFMQNAGIADV